MHIIETAVIRVVETLSGMPVAVTTIDAPLAVVAGALSTVVGAAFKFLIDRLGRLESREETRVEALLNATAAINSTVESNKQLVGVVGDLGKAVESMQSVLTDVASDVRSNSDRLDIVVRSPDGLAGGRRATDPPVDRRRG